LDTDLSVFTRLSEVELSPAYVERAEGVWLDAFESEWYSNMLIEDLTKKGKKVCIVSPELHGRPHIECWRNLKALPTTNQIILCTDLPKDAMTYFQGK
jgi:hypothetical protein